MSVDDPQAALRRRYRAVWKRHREERAALIAAGVPDHDVARYTTRIDWAPFVDLVCGARTRAGGRCKMRGLFSCGRCKLHGGMSTGPRTEAGKERAKLNANQRRPASIAHGVGGTAVPDHPQPGARLDRSDPPGPVSG